MKQILSVITIITTTITFLNATSPYLTAYYFRQNQQYRDSIDNLPSGNYFTIQPGLYDIANQMPDKEGRAKKNKDPFSPLGAYPILLNFSIKELGDNAIDTFQYNWKDDIIVCVNCVDIAKGDWCELISSKDSVLAVEYLPSMEMTRNQKTELKTNVAYLNALKNWDKAILDSICEYNPPKGRFIIHSSSSFSLSRLVVKNGRLADVKYIKCKAIDTSRIK